MRGHLEERGKNVWRAKVYVGLHDGRKRYETRTIHGTKKYAQGVLNELLVELGQAEFSVVDGTLNDLASRWMALASATLSPTTIAEYQRLLDKRILPKFGSTKVREIRAADLDAYYAQLQRRSKGEDALGAQSIRHIHALIRRLLNQAVKWGWIATNPATRASPPRLPRDNLELPGAQAVAKILDAAA